MEEDAGALRACQAAVWRSHFEPRAAYATQVLELSAAEEAYVVSDSIMATDLPRAVRGPSASQRGGRRRLWRRTRSLSYAAQVPGEVGGSDAETSSDEGSEAEAPPFEGLAALRVRIDAAIQACISLVAQHSHRMQPKVGRAAEHGPSACPSQTLGGRVIPKLNWSCPKDATWISAAGLVCCCADEVLLLLKSSDRVAHDVDLLARLRSGDASSVPASTTAAVDGANDFVSAAGAAPSTAEGDSGAADGAARWPAQLALTKAFSLRDGREFRCFVRCRALVGACQRDPTQHFPGVVGERVALSAMMRAFHVISVQESTFPLSDCALPLLRVLAGCLTGRAASPQCGSAV